MLVVDVEVVTIHLASAMQAAMQAFMIKDTACPVARNDSCDRTCGRY